MKVQLLYIQSGKEEWVEKSQILYHKKINRFLDFEIKTIKTSSASREKKEEKIKFESQKIFKKITTDDYVVIFDEKATQPKGSVGFSEQLLSLLESSKKRIVFIMGGAFGLSDEIKSRAQMKISLSRLTMSHHVAQVVILEQIYRALTIHKKIPYHNE